MTVLSKYAEELLHDSILTEIVQRLTSAFHPERIYLFGSVARGEAGPHSDYDLLMVGIRHCQDTDVIKKHLESLQE